MTIVSVKLGNFFNHAQMTMAYLVTHQLELLAAFAGLMNIYLAARNSMWNWFFGIITVTLYLIIFYHVKLYADMSLQLVFLVMQFYGIYQWRYGGDNKSHLNIRRAPLRIYCIAALNVWILFAVITYTLHRYTDSTTVCIDACTTALSLVAQWMMSRKWIEHWWLWITINFISIDMYFYKNLYFTSTLYGIFILLNVIGYRHWRQNLFLADINNFKKNPDNLAVK